MKIVDSIPVVVDRSSLTNCAGGVEMTPPYGKRPRRFRTVSESAVKSPLLNDITPNDGTTSSLRNIAEHKETTERVQQSAAAQSESSSSSSCSSKSATTSNKSESAPLSHAAYRKS